MKLHQLSLFLENKPGHLSAVCRKLGDAGISVTTLALADTEQFGILRLIVRDWEKARDTLQQAGVVVNVTEVVAAIVEDRPGGLADVLEILDRAEVNIEYMYAFTFPHEEQPVIVFRFDDPDAAIEVLQKNDIRIVDNATVFGA